MGHTESCEERQIRGFWLRQKDDISGLAGIGFYGFEEGLAEGGFEGRVEFGAAMGEIEDVDGHLALGVDEGNFDVAGVAGEGGGERAQKARGVLRDDL